MKSVKAFNVIPDDLTNPTAVFEYGLGIRPVKLVNPSGDMTEHYNAFEIFGDETKLNQFITENDLIDYGLGAPHDFDPNFWAEPLQSAA